MAKRAVRKKEVKKAVRKRAVKRVLPVPNAEIIEGMYDAQITLVNPQRRIEFTYFICKGGLRHIVGKMKFKRPKSGHGTPVRITIEKAAWPKERGA